MIPRRRQGHDSSLLTWRKTTKLPTSKQCAFPACEDSDDDIWYMKVVRFDEDDCTGRESHRPGRMGEPCVPSPVYNCICLSATVSARQRALDLGKVVDLLEGNLNRRWRTEATMLSDDRRPPVMWVTSEVGLVYDCFTALHVDNDDYCPVRSTDYRCCRETTMISLNIRHGDIDYHY